MFYGLIIGSSLIPIAGLIAAFGRKNLAILINLFATACSLIAALVALFSLNIEPLESPLSPIVNVTSGQLVTYLTFLICFSGAAQFLLLTSRKNSKED